MAAIKRLGVYAVVEKADLSSKSHNINYSGPAPELHEGISKYAGMHILVNTGTAYVLAIAEGPLDTDKWWLLDGTTAAITPA